MSEGLCIAKGGLGCLPRESWEASQPEDVSLEAGGVYPLIEAMAH